MNSYPQVIHRLSTGYPQVDKKVLLKYNKKARAEKHLNYFGCFFVDIYIFKL
jgi:hypothetical protein